MSTLKHRLFNRKKQAQLLTEMRVLIAGGLDMKVVAESFSDHGGNTQQLIGKEMISAMNKGKPTCEALKPWIHPLAYSCLTVGEKTGDWVKALDNAVLQLNSGGSSIGGMLFQIAKSSMFFSGSCLMAQLAYTKLFPVLEEIIPPNKWQGETEFAQSFSAIFAHYNAVALIVFVLVLAWLFYELPRPIGSMRKHLDNMPIFSQYRLIQTASLLRSTGNLVAGGVDISDAIDHFEPTANRYIKSHIKIIKRNIQMGRSNLGDIFDSGLLKPVHLNSLKTMGAIGEHDKILSNITAILDTQINFQISLISTAIPSALRTLGFCIIAVIAFGLMSAMFSIASLTNSY